MANFKRYSRYSVASATTNRNGNNFLILRNPLNLEKSSTDTNIIVSQEFENRPDLLANKLYNEPELWWVIYEFNEIKDPFFDLKAGQILRIPTLERILEALNSIEV